MKDGLRRPHSEVHHARDVSDGCHVRSRMSVFVPFVGFVIFPSFFLRSTSKRTLLDLAQWDVPDLPAVGIWDLHYRTYRTKLAV